VETTTPEERFVVFFPLLMALKIWIPLLSWEIEILSKLN
jgi:hypothetical protein